MGPRRSAVDLEDVAPMYGSDQSKSKQRPTNRQVEKSVHWIMQIDNINAAAAQEPQELKKNDREQKGKRDSAYEPSWRGERNAKSKFDSLKALFRNPCS